MPIEPATDTEDAARKARIVRCAVLAAIVGVGAAYRLYGLGTQSLWNDELSSWWRSEPVAFGVMWKRIVADVHPAGYYLVLNLWQRMFGHGELTLRLLSVLFGTATLVLAYRWGSFAGGPRTGMLSAALMAFAPDLIIRSQSARPYALLVLCSIGLGHALHEHALAVDERRRLPWRAVVSLGVWSALTAHVHYVGVVLAGVGWLGLAVLIVARRSGWHMLLGLAVGVALYVPWLPWFFGDLAKGGLNSAKKIGWRDLFDAWAPFQPKWLSAACWALVPVSFIGIRSSGEPARRRELLTTCLLLAWALAPSLAIFLKSSISSSIWTRRNYAPAHAAVTMLFAYSFVRLYRLERVRERRRLRLASLAAAASLVVWLAFRPFASDYYTHVRNTQFREVTGWVVDNRRARRAPIVSYGWQAAYLDYYLEHHRSTRRVQTNARTSRKLFSALKQQAKRSERVWLVAAHKPVSPDMKRRLRSRYRIVDSARFHQASAYLLQSRRAARKSEPNADTSDPDTKVEKAEFDEPDDEDQ